MLLSHDARKMWTNASVLHAELAAHSPQDRNDECFFRSFAWKE